MSPVISLCHDEAFILRKQPYTESQNIVVLWCKNLGKVEGIVSSKKIFINTLTLYHISLYWKEKGLCRISKMTVVKEYILKPACLLICLNLNKILYSGFQCLNLDNVIFDQFQQLLTELAKANTLDLKHRSQVVVFKKMLIQRSGYGFQAKYDTAGKALLPHLRYRFVAPGSFQLDVQCNLYGSTVQKLVYDTPNNCTMYELNLLNSWLNLIFEYLAKL